MTAEQIFTHSEEQKVGGARGRFASSASDGANQRLYQKKKSDPRTVLVGEHYPMSISPTVIPIDSSTLILRTAKSSEEICEFLIKFFHDFSNSFRMFRSNECCIAGLYHDQVFDIDRCNGVIASLTIMHPWESIPRCEPTTVFWFSSGACNRE